MPQGNFENFVYGTVATAPSPPDSGTTFTLTPVGGTVWPSVPFNLTIYPTGTGPLTTNAEIVQVTAMTGDTVDACVRGSQGSTPRTILVGDQAANAITLDDVLAFLSGGGSGTGQIVTTGVFVGTAAVDEVFGYYKAQRDHDVAVAQIFAQTAPTGADLQIELVDAAGVSLGVTAILPDGDSFSETSIPLTLATGDTVRFKITQVGSTEPGGYVTINLL